MYLSIKWALWLSASQREKTGLIWPGTYNSMNTWQGYFYSSYKSSHPVQTSFWSNGKIFIFYRFLEYIHPWNNECIYLLTWIYLSQNKLSLYPSPVSVPYRIEYSAIAITKVYLLTEREKERGQSGTSRNSAVLFSGDRWIDN